jgi:hypothetical protein
MTVDADCTVWFDGFRNIDRSKRQETDDERAAASRRGRTTATTPCSAPVAHGSRDRGMGQLYFSSERTQLHFPRRCERQPRPGPPR